MQPLLDTLAPTISRCNVSCILAYSKPACRTFLCLKRGVKDQAWIYARVRVRVRFRDPLLCDPGMERLCHVTAAAHLADVVIDGDVPERGAQRGGQGRRTATAGISFEQCEQRCRRAVLRQRARVLERPAFRGRSRGWLRGRTSG